MARLVTGAEVDRSEWAALADDEVVRRVLGGERSLFEVLMRRYNQRLYRVARSILRDQTEAEDVMQHAYVEAYRHLEQFEGRARFSTWLTKIAVHEALARARRRRRDATHRPRLATDEDPMSMLPSPEPGPEEQALSGEVRALLEAAIEALPVTHRSVFVLRDVEGLSTAEAADCLEVSEDTVKMRLHRARARLREDLLRRAGTASSAAFSFHLSRCDRVVAAVFAQLREVPARIH